MLRGKIDCSQCSFEHLDLSNNPALTHLRCARNKLSSLDVSNNTKLKTLVVANNPIGALDVTMCPAIDTLWCEGNGLRALDLSKSQKLIWLNCSRNEIEELDFSNTELGYLLGQENKIRKIDMGEKTFGTTTDYLYMKLNDNCLESLDLSRQPHLAWVELNNNNLQSLDVNACMRLRGILCNNNPQLSELKFEQLSEVWQIHCSNCNLSGTGRVSVTSEYVSGTTAVSLVETSTSDDLTDWSDWAAVPADGRLTSPNRAYIRFRVTLTTSDTARTPKLIDIRLYDIPKAPYEKIGYARPVVLDGNGAWEAVLENAYDIIVTGEINGEDTLSFKIPYRDGKRGYIDSEKKIQIVDDVYKVRTVTDTRDTDGSAVTEVYAEAEFYDLTFSVRKEERTFEAEYPEAAMSYPVSVVPTQLFLTASGENYIPSQRIIGSVGNFARYTYTATGELAYVVHQGVLTKSQMERITAEAGGM